MILDQINLAKKTKSFLGNRWNKNGANFFFGKTKICIAIFFLQD